MSILKSAKKNNPQITNIPNLFSKNVLWNKLTLIWIMHHNSNRCYIADVRVTTCLCSPVIALLLESSAGTAFSSALNLNLCVKHAQASLFYTANSFGGRVGARRGVPYHWITAASPCGRIMRRWTRPPSFGGSYEVRENISTSGYWLHYHVGISG
jgi:hypothetical protein